MIIGLGVRGRADTGTVTAPAMHFLGHSTVRVELAGRTVLTDPLLGHGVGPLRRVVPLPDPSTWAGVDVVLISHLHNDHLHLPSLAGSGATCASWCPAARAAGCSGSGSGRWTSCRPVRA